MPEITLTFEEVPLHREPGLVAGLVSGEADIRIHDEGEWSIVAIRLDGMLDNEKHASPWPCCDLDRNSWLFTTIHAELEANWKDVIEDRVADKLGEWANA